MNVPPPPHTSLRESAVQDERFWAKTRAEGECIVYTGHRDRQGYGKVMRKAVSPYPVLAHRYAWYLAHGPFGDGLVIRHTCDNPPCVNPDHLRDGTQADNIADRQARGRHRPGRLLGEAHPAHRLTEAEVRAIRVMYQTWGWTIQEIADFHRVHYSTIQRITSGRGWRHTAA